jgi:hypothetical protein
MKLENSKQYDVIFLDLAKAFDRVPHTLLLHKLKSFGYSGTLLNWFNSYLSNRQQCVVINGIKSKFSHACSGVPQGSILGPLLFLYYINDLFSYVNDPLIEIFLYADDAKVGSSINSVVDSARLQNVLNNIINWSNKWGMVFNAKKCEFMSILKGDIKFDYVYKINNVALNRVTNFTDLGIIVNNKLTWEEHVQYCIKRANQRLGLIKRFTGYTCNIDLKLLLYTSLVRPLVEFSSQVWMCKTVKLTKNLESIQRRASKYILNDFESNYTNRLIKLNILPLVYRREYLDLIFYYNSLYDIIDVNMNIFPMMLNHVNVITRLQHDNMLLTNTNVKYLVHDQFYTRRIVRLWNCLPSKIRKIPLTEMGNNTSFKRELKLWYFELLVNKFNEDNTCTWSARCICCKCKP